jgi:hypothetical protein
LSEALEDVPRGPAKNVVLASLTTMIIDLGASVSPSSRDPTLKQAFADIYEIIHDFAVDRDDLRVRQFSFVYNLFSPYRYKYDFALSCMRLIATLTIFIIHFGPTLFYTIHP